ncbi:MAG TPA: hypothetical protein VMV52_00820 [Candidatus Nanopelagicaceae bacterium]|nr:hypothetical protein [Candidatus Nanopelagicaceae bacterium]
MTTGKKAAKVPVFNANHPEMVRNLDAAKYDAVKTALFKVLPKRPPGLTQIQLRGEAAYHLPEHLFPNGEKSAWWIKSVQLDLEAKGEIVREEDAHPLRWHRA